jgi:hypothetical protein
MTTHAKFLGVATLATMTALSLAAHPALAQRAPTAARVTPAAATMPMLARATVQAQAMRMFNPGSQPFNLGSGSLLAATFSPFPSAALGLYGSGSMTSVSPYGTAYPSNPALNSTSPYGSGNPYDPYANSYYPDPYGGGLQGAAAAISAQGKYEQAQARSRILNQSVEQEKINTRHRILEEWLYERALTPTLQQQREATQALELRRALQNPALAEILSGYALDLILDDLKAKLSQGAHGQAASLDPAILKQINVTSKASIGNLGALKPLKDGAPLSWPLPLQGEAYQEEVRRVNQKVVEAVQLVQSTGQVDAGALNDMQDDLDRLRAKVKSNINELLPTQVIEANRFLKQLESSRKALQQPDASKYLLDQFVAKGRTVPELIDHMATKGLSFAPATEGEEAAYLALHNFLKAFDRSLQAAQPSSVK